MTELQVFLMNDVPGAKACGKKEYGVAVADAEVVHFSPDTYDISVPDLPHVELIDKPINAIDDAIKRFYQAKGCTCEMTHGGFIVKQDNKSISGITITQLSDDRVRISEVKLKY